jgi:hypothetical protein
LSLPLLLLLLAGCGESDSPLAPPGEETGPPRIVSFFATDTDLVHGEYSQLRWELERGTSASISPEIGSVSPSGVATRPVRPYEDITYTLTVSNSSGSVSEDVTLHVTYRPGFYVDSVDGDDAADGGTPQTALASLAEAMTRTTGGGTIYLSGGVYATNVEITGPGRLIFGSLNPDTFFEDLETYPSVLRPSSGAPLRIVDAAGTATLIRGVQVDARFGGTYALEVENSFVFLESSTFDARLSVSGTGVRIAGTSNVQMHSCRVLGGNAPVPHDNATGIRLLDSSELHVANSFVSGGRGQTSSSGLDIDTSGIVSVALCTVSARSETALGGAGSASLRIRRGNPFIGGNILFTQGTGERHAVAEEGPEADPARFEGNLLVAAGTPPYDNWMDDGDDAITEDDLNDFQRINGLVTTVRENLLVTGLTTSQMFVDPANGDFHLIHPMLMGGANPAVNRGSILVSDAYGFTLDDIDGDRRPSTWSQMDRGGDEN